MTSRFIRLVIALYIIITSVNAIGGQKITSDEWYPTYTSVDFDAVEVNGDYFTPHQTYVFYPDTVFYIRWLLKCVYGLIPYLSPILMNTSLN